MIALKSGWEVEVSEKGGVRLWLQTESLSNAAELRLICNDHEISGTPVGLPASLQLYVLKKDQHSCVKDPSFIRSFLHLICRSSLTFVKVLGYFSVPNEYVSFNQIKKKDQYFNCRDKIRKKTLIRKCIFRKCRKK